MVSSRVRYVLLQPLSLLITWFILLSTFSVYTGLIAQSYIFIATLTLASAVGLRYAAVYHRFSTRTYRLLALVPLTIILLVASTIAFDTLRSTVSLEAFYVVFQSDSFRIGSTNFLPNWWIAVLLVPAGVLSLAGSVLPGELSPYPKPTEIREIAMSPVYFSVACIVFGLWAVLLVGISLQRVIIIAPIFEELLKFGVALLVGSVFFGRSFPARIGVAIVVGSLFGIIEHATTYPMEADAIYLFRTLFHTTTTVLSVSVYTVFERRGPNEFRWIAPVYPILLHFFYNTFAVLSAVIGVSVFGSSNTTITLLYGAAVILLAVVLVLLAGISQKTLVAIHRPLKQFLSEFV